MLFNYIKIAVRNAHRNLAYSLINIVGLTIGLTVFILIYLWIEHELSYDNFHKNSDRLYRIVENRKLSNGEQLKTVPTPPPLATHLKNNFPEIEEAFRLVDSRFILRHEDKSFVELGLMADPSIFTSMTFPFIDGTPETAMPDLNSIVICKKLATKYFGDHDPIGRIFHIENTSFKVTAVLADFPENSHLKFDFIVPFELWRTLGWNSLTGWTTYIGTHTYVMLREDASMDEVSLKIRDAVMKNVPASGTTTEIFLQPLLAIHLHSDFANDIGTHGNIQYVYIFDAVAIFILIIACINFMNLSTAQSVKRGREVGMRKVIGAQRSQLVVQFLSESVIFACLALVIAFIASVLIAPVFSEMSGKNIEINFQSGFIWKLLLVSCLLTGLMAGIYPALFLSSFRPIKVLKGTFKAGKGATVFRKVLVVFQFTLCTILLVSTMVIYSQFHFIRTKNIGLNRENIIGLWSWTIGYRSESFKNDLLARPEVAGVSLSSASPVNEETSQSSTRFETFEWEDKSPDDQVMFQTFFVDGEFLSVFQIQLKEGRNFSMSHPDGSSVILNEEAVRAMRMDDPVGKSFGGATIVGIVHDFHFQSLHRPIEPLALFMDSARYNYGRINIKLRSGDMKKGIKSVQEVYSKYASSANLDFSILDEDLDRQYRSEEHAGQIYNYFACIAIFISCLGLLGLVMFTIEQRTREIAIRKVLGATVGNIFGQISSEFIKLVLAANIISIPMAYYIMDDWLKRFAYHIDIHWSVFIAAALFSLVVAWLTLSLQSIKAAISSPVSSLRKE